MDSISTTRLEAADEPLTGYLNIQASAEMCIQEMFIFD